MARFLGDSMNATRPLALLLAALAGCNPSISGLEPTAACPGGRVAVLGSGFGPLQGSSNVAVGGVDAGKALLWSDARIEFRVPAGAATGAVAVEVGGTTETGPALTVLSGALVCRGSLIPGPAEPGYDAELEAKARMYDRGFHALHALPMGANTEVVVPVENAADRELVRAFLQDSDGWDFEAFSGKSPYDVITAWQKTAGMYAGAGIAADAYRYGVLRDTGYPSEEVDRAREFLLRGLDAIHLAATIPGVPGVIARGFLRTDIPGPGATQPLTPLFDEAGDPLPPEKNNGTWRADNSGLYPNYIWEDSCSRDMFLGWASAIGPAAEVIAEDPTIPEEYKTRLAEDALGVGTMFSTVQASGHDLEIQDADGRPTFHAYLHEHSFDRYYTASWFHNGMHAIMDLGILGALARASGDAGLESYLYDTLIAARNFTDIVASNTIGTDFGVQTNYSNVNMAFTGAWLAVRYIEGAQAREDLRTMLRFQLYDKLVGERLPKELGQSLFDFTYAAGLADSAAFQAMTGAPDAGALARGLQTLREFPTPPFWDYGVENCDAAEIASGVCFAPDGTRFDLLGDEGRGDTLVAKQPVPMRLRPPSNYYWRSNPYQPNGGGSGAALYPGVDFRFAYWAGRWAR